MGAKAYEKLPCKLSASEKLAKSEQLARELKRHAELELEKSLTAQRLSKAIKESDRTVADLAEEIRSGIEMREVPVRHEKRGSRLVTVRVDDGAEVGSRPLEAHERQQALFERPIPPDDEDDDDDEDADAGQH